MGEVYRARDSKLDREVAIKILPSQFTADTQRLLRLSREARALAALNHPNIAQIYGIEESADGPALVMELVQGAPIQGPLPEDLALRYAKQIAGALDAAHEKGIVHRDLKPANILLTLDGVVKVLDFGLASIPPPSEPAGDETLTLPVATGPSVIMGTPGYMSPEQATGQPTDKRTDIFAFGVVIYEILTGRPLFSGDTASKRIAAVMMESPDLSRIPPRTRQLVQRCLAKDPKARLRDIGDAFLPESPVPQTPGRLPYWLLVAGMLASGIAGWFLRPAPSHPEPNQRMFSLTPPGLDNRAFLNRSVISPNGRHIVYVAARKLWVRDLIKEQARSLDDIDNPEGPFWSPDSSQIAFASGLDLKKVKLDGSPPLTLAKLPASFRGGAWSPDGKSILVATLRSGIAMVPAEGGSLKQIIGTTGALSYYSPHFIPSAGGLFAVASKGTFAEQTLEWIDIARGTSKTLRTGAYPSYAPSGHILFQSEPGKGDVWALRVAPQQGIPDGEAVAIPGLNASCNPSSPWLKSGERVKTIEGGNVPR
jgi:serine/threonine-protein kinase